jgi:hypothetical protein
VKKPIVVFLTCLILCFISSAQGGWKQNLYPQNAFTSRCQNAIETPNGNLIYVGLISDTVNHQTISKLAVVLADKFGNFINIKKYGQLNFQYMYISISAKASILKGANSFFLTTIARDTSKYISGLLIKFDYNGDTIWQKKYKGANTDVMPFSLNYSTDGGILLCGNFIEWQTPSTGKVPLMILKTDISGNEKWRKKIYNTNGLDFLAGSDVIQDSVSKKIIVVGSQQSYGVQGGGNAVSYQGYVLCTDSVGNKIWEKSLNNFGAGGYGQIVKLKDKNYITCGGWSDHSTINDFYLNGYVVKFDINGTILWSKKVFEPDIDNFLLYLTERTNGDIVVCGSISIDQIPKGGRINPVLLKLDSNGNLLKQQVIGHNYKGGYEYPISFAPTSDNGFLISTFFYGKGNPTPFSIIKVDSTVCDSTSAWCTEVALGNDELENRNVKWEVFPNPANEMINFTFPQAQGSNTFIKITDISGREIENITLQNDTKLSINTSSYQTGIYFVTLYYNTKAIETKKLMIVR